MDSSHSFLTLLLSVVATDNQSPFCVLGVGEEDCSEAEFPKVLPLSKNVNFVHVCAGSFSNAAIDSEGGVWTWGQVRI